MFAQYFEHYAFILGGHFFLDTLYSTAAYYGLHCSLFVTVSSTSMKGFVDLQ